MRSPLLKSSGIYIGAALLNALFPFLLMPLLTRALPPDQYGVVGTFAALVNLGSVLVGLSTHGLISAKFFGSKPADFARCVTACLVIAAITASVLLLGLPLVHGAIARTSGVVSGWQWTIVAASTGQFMIAVALAVCQIRGQALRFGALQVANTALNMTLTLILVLGMDMGWQGRALAHAVVALSVGFVGLLMLRHSKSLAFTVRKSDLFEVLRFGLPLVPHAAAGVLMGSVDRLVLTGLVGPAASGQYFVAFQVASIVTLVSAALNQAWVPWLYKRLSLGNDQSKKEIVSVTYIIFGGVILIGLAVAVMSPLLIKFLAGDSYSSSAKFVPILTVAATFNGMYFFVTNYIFYSRRTELLSICTTLVVVVQVAAAMFFVQRVGLWGAACVSAFSALVYFVAVFAIAQRLIPMPWLRAKVA